MVAPYATALALMVAPEAACANLQRLAAEGLRRQVRLLRGHRLHARAPAARANERRRALVHGASPGHEPAVAGAPAARPADAAALRVRPAVPGDRCCCCRSACRRPARCLLARRRSASTPAARGRHAETPMRVLHTTRHADPGGAAAVQRPLPRDGDQRRRRLQPLEGPGGHALARGRHLRQLGHVLLPARRGERRVLVDRAPADAASARSTTRRSSPRRAPSSAAATTDIETHTEIVVSPEDDIELRRVAHHQPLAHAAHDRGHQLRRSGAGAAPPPTRCIRRSATCSCRPRSSGRGRPSSARAGRARATSSRRGCST